MLGTWNATIKTPFMQIFALFTISKENNGEILFDLKTEPMDLNLTLKEIHEEGNKLKVSYQDTRGSSMEFDLSFEENVVLGVLKTPMLGEISFEGNKGESVSLGDKLKKYGEKSVEENHLWNGKWIWDEKQPELEDEMNHKLVYFRRSFNIEEGVNPTLTIDITADSRYRLFVNGQSVSVGPCKGDNHVQYYETIDVSDYLVSGKNVLAVKVMRYPSSEPFKMGDAGPISVWRSQSAGLFVEASLKDENGLELEALHSGANWFTLRDSGYKHIAKPFIEWMGGVEVVDGAAVPHGWMDIQFDDSDWKPAIPFAETRNFAGILSPWNLVPRPIPFMYETERDFQQVIKSEGVDHEQVNSFIRNETLNLKIPSNEKVVMEIDAGELMTGYLTLGMTNGRNSTIRIKCAEGYEPLESDIQRRIKDNREDSSGKLVGESDTYYVAGSGNDQYVETYEPFWFRTFRYVQLEVETSDEPLELQFFNYRETGYPLEVKATFESSDEQLNQLWDMSVRTLKRCMHETYEDCPYYEQLQYAMDSRLMMLFTYLTSADDRMPRRTINDFYRSRQSTGMLQSRYPSMQPQVIPSFALYWIDMIDEHYSFNGDKEIIETYRPAIIELLDWYHERLTPDGIVGVTSNRFWTYFDWVEAWPLGSPAESLDRPMYLLSFMYAASLRKASDLMRVTGWNDVATTMDERADHIGNALRKSAWNEDKKMFRDLPDTEIYSQHTQVMAVLADVVKGKEAKELMERTLSEEMNQVTLPFSYLLIQALKKTGLHHRIFGLWDRWRAFLSQGLTTLPETEKNPRSDCHAWSSVPLAEFPSTILGVNIIKPASTKVEIEPQIGNLKWAKGSVATVQGMIDVSWWLEGDNFTIDVKVPTTVTAQITLPDGSSHNLQGEGQFKCEYPNEK